MVDRNDELERIRQVLKHYRTLRVEPIEALFKLRNARLTKNDFEKYLSEIRGSIQKLYDGNIIPYELYTDLTSTRRKMERAMEDEILSLMTEAVNQIADEYSIEVEQYISEYIVDLKWKRHPEAIPYFRLNRREELIMWDKKYGWIYPRRKDIKPDYVKRYIVDWWGEDIYEEALGRDDDGKGGKPARDSF